MRKILKWFLWLFISVVLLFGITCYIVYKNRDKVIQIFINEINQHIQTKVLVDKIEFDIFTHFPQLFLGFYQVSIYGSAPFQDTKVANFEKVSLTFNLYDLLNSDYKIKSVIAEKGFISLIDSTGGTLNYEILKAKKDSSQDSQINFKLSKLIFKHTNFTYKNTNQRYEVYNDELVSDLVWSESGLRANLEGNCLRKQIKIENDNYLSFKRIKLNAHINYQKLNNLLEFLECEILNQKATYIIKGTQSLKGLYPLNLSFEGKNTDMQTLIGFLPERFVQKFKDYKSKGAVYFKGKVNGNTAANTPLEVKVNFGCESTSFFHPEYKKKIENLSLKGYFEKSKYNDGILKLENLTGNLENQSFEGRFLLKNIKAPFIDFSFKTQIEVNDFLDFFPIEDVENASGMLAIDLVFAGKISDLKSKEINKKILTSGTLDLANLSFGLKNVNLKYLNFNGNFVFNNNDIKCDHFTGKIGESDFLLNGDFKNIIPWLLVEDQMLVANASLESNFIELEQFLKRSILSPKENAKINQASKSTQKNTAFGSKFIEASLKVKVNHLLFQRFSGKNISGDIQLSNGGIEYDKVKMQVIGGQFDITGFVKPKNEKFYQSENVITANKIAIDSAFYVFDNFGQDFITQRNLKGNIFSQVKCYFLLDPSFKLQPESVIAEIKLKIENGRMLDFAPLQKMSQFIKKEELADIKFTELNNTIYIKDKVIEIPEMTIKSNVNTFSVKGTHNFDKVMNYRIKVSLLKDKADKDEKYGEVEASNKSLINLFLKIQGTNDNFKVSYDVQAVGKNIKEGIKREVNEFLDLFKNKNKESEKNKKTEPEKEEYLNLD